MLSIHGPTDDVGSEPPQGGTGVGLALVSPTGLRPGLHNQLFTVGLSLEVTEGRQISTLSHTHLNFPRNVIPTILLLTGWRWRELAISANQSGFSLLPTHS